MRPPSTAVTLPWAALEAAFGPRLQRRVPLAPYTSARLGGPADALLVVRSADELAAAVAWLWAHEVPFVVLGGGSNVLVSDAGVRGVVLFNKAAAVRFGEDEEGPWVWAESGANLGRVARQAAARGLAGLEWAAGIPGTVGGAVVGNAGAHGGDLAGVLRVAEILHRREGRVTWPVERLAYGYRTSALKAHPGEAVVLAATLRLRPDDPQAVQARLAAHRDYRQRTQPPGASMGSMFKNPPGDYAGRLIEAAGLKGTRIGGAEISPVHANFIVNHGEATARDVAELLRLARRTVAERFGVRLELEIQLVGDWPPEVRDDLA